MHSTLYSIFIFDLQHYSIESEAEYIRANRSSNLGIKIIETKNRLKYFPPPTPKRPIVNSI